MPGSTREPRVVEVAVSAFSNPFLLFGQGRTAPDEPLPIRGESASPSTTKARIAKERCSAIAWRGGSERFAEAPKPELPSNRKHGGGRRRDLVAMCRLRRSPPWP